MKPQTAITSAFVAISMVASFLLVNTEIKLDAKSAELDAVKSELVEKTSYRKTSVQECKRSVGFVKDVAPLFNFEKGEGKTEFIKRIFELTDNPAERQQSAYLSTVLFVSIAASGQKEYSPKDTSEILEKWESDCNNHKLEKLK